MFLIQIAEKYNDMVSDHVYGGKGMFSAPFPTIEEARVALKTAIGSHGRIPISGAKTEIKDGGHWVSYPENGDITTFVFSIVRITHCE